MPEQDTDWIVTRSGQRIHYSGAAMGLNAYLMEDIAHGLSMLCRFAGQTRSFYSVAQHSVLCSRNVDVRGCSSGEARTLRRLALMHDASEAYMVDVPRPLKHMVGMGTYRRIEGEFQRAILEDFGLAGHPEWMAGAVGYADNAVLMAERRDLLAFTGGLPWGELEEIPPVGDIIHPQTPCDAKASFIAEARLLRLVKSKKQP